LNVLVLDLETTVDRFDGKIDGSPFNPANKCVSAHYCWLNKGGVTNLVFNHNEKLLPDSLEILRTALAKADVLVAHNAKFDCLWLVEMGLTLPPLIRCTMINEYILSKGQRRPLSLKATAERRDVTRKRSDLVDDLFKSGTGFEAMPLGVVLEYAEADVISCAEIYDQQQKELSLTENLSLNSVVEFMNEMLVFLLEIERNGIKVDLDALALVKVELQEEYSLLSRRLRDIVESVMGDSPINLNSGRDMTKVVYSREVTDRQLHIDTWNIGLQPNGKPKYPPRMKKSEFSKAVRDTTKIIHKTDALCCSDCNGTGKIQKYKTLTRQKNGKKYRVAGEAYKNPSKCTTCAGLGAIYHPTGQIAGLRLNPQSPAFASVNGFKTDKGTIALLISQAKEKGNDIAVEFLEKISRLNALSTYLDSFVKGLETWTRHDGILHSSFNQCITATGRLSSSNPNFQNQPKRGFPVRKAVTSRFQDGIFYEFDFSSVEFRVAGAVSKDRQVIDDVLNDKDIHKQTASIIHQIPADQVTKDQRQSCKLHSFAPLFGSMGNGLAAHEKKYYDEFFVIYKDIGKYQQGLMNGVLRDGIVTSPSGRQYFWPNVERLRNGRVTNATQIVNYPIQGLAADLVQLSCIRAYRAIKSAGLKSLLVLTVHDSICLDVYPGEENQIKTIISDAMTGVGDEAKIRWDYDFPLPLEIEATAGKNWFDQHDIVLT